MKDVKTNQRHLDRKVPGEDDEGFWTKVYSRGALRVAENNALPVYYRLHHLAQAKMDGKNHAEFEPGELIKFFSVNPGSIYAAIDRAVKEGLLDEGSSPRCLRYPRSMGKNNSFTMKPCQGRKTGAEVPGNKTKDLEELFHRLLDNGKERSTVIRLEARKIASDRTIRIVKRKLKIKSFRQGGYWWMAFPVGPKKKKVTGKPAKKPTKPSKQRKLTIVRPKQTKPAETKSRPKKYVLVRSPIVKARENSSRILSPEYIDIEKLDEMSLELASGNGHKNKEAGRFETQEQRIIQDEPWLAKWNKKEEIKQESFY